MNVPKTMRELKAKPVILLVFDAQTQLKYVIVQTLEVSYETYIFTKNKGTRIHFLRRLNK